jgi:hypothetical protein
VAWILKLQDIQPVLDCGRAFPSLAEFSSLHSIIEKEGMFWFFNPNQQIKPQKMQSILLAHKLAHARSLKKIQNRLQDSFDISY